MAVRIRMKKMGRAHRHFFRICAIDKRSPRDGRVLEELGTYNPQVINADARAILKKDRVDYWLSVGAQPSEKCAILIKKFGTNGTHEDAQKAALDQLALPVDMPDPGEPASLPKSDEPVAEEAAATPEAPAPAAEASGESPSPEAPASEAPKADEPAK